METSALSSLLSSLTSVLAWVITSLTSIFDFMIENPVMILFMALGVAGTIFHWGRSIVRA